MRMDTPKAAVIRRMDRLTPDAIYCYALDLYDRLEAAEAALAELQYRHECLKSIYDDIANCIPPHTVDMDIDDFICEQESHS
jgi:hypothetical protein